MSDFQCFIPFFIRASASTRDFLLRRCCRFHSLLHQGIGEQVVMTERITGFVPKALDEAHYFMGSSRTRVGEFQEF
jgi:hypothetical protein